VVADGDARRAAEELAAQIALHPQRCLRNDRLSAHEQWSLSLADAMTNEFRRGEDSIASGESAAGAGRFSQGRGRHGGMA
jgi:enoyl-CoA hydratase